MTPTLQEIEKHIAQDEADLKAQRATFSNAVLPATIISDIFDKNTPCRIISQSRSGGYIVIRNLATNEENLLTAKEFDNYHFRYLNKVDELLKIQGFAK